MSRVFKKKWMVYVAVLVIFTFTLSACSVPTTNATTNASAVSTTKNATTAASTAPKATTTVVENKAVTAWLGSWWATEIPKIQDKFAAAYPGYTVKIESVPINNYVENAITAIVGGNPPDALDLDAIMIPTPVGQNLLLPMDDMMKRYNLTTAMFSPGIYKAGVSNGVNYAIPDRTAPSVLMYNKTMFDKAGVKYPYDNMPLAEFLEVCKKMNIPGVQYAYGIAGSKSDPANVMSSFCPALWGFGGDFLTADLKQSALNTPNSVAGIKYWVELYTKYKVVPEGSINYAITKDLIPLFFNNQMAMVQMNDSNVLKAPEYAKTNKFETGMCVQPGPFSRGGGWSFTIPVTAKNVAGAEKFIAFFIQPEVLGAQQIVMPGVLAAQKSSTYWSNPTFDIYYKAEASTKTLPFHPKWTEIQNIIVMELQDALQGINTPEVAAQKMNDRINQLIAK